MRLIERIWTGESIRHRLLRRALAPLETLYRSVMVVRGRLFDHGVIPVRASPIGVVSVGNLTVGGTGKTPVSAWVAAQLAEMGRKPVIVLRGYGDDEPLVHARLNPAIPVIVERERVKGIAAAAHMGADAAVLDDAFQHRSAQRDLDVVLISADDWTEELHVLPAGPYREPPEGMRRASIVIVTAKAVSSERIVEVERWASSVAPGKPVAAMRLVLSGLVCESPKGESLPLEALANRRVLAVAAVGNPGAFFQQIEALGATVTPLAFADHHAFTAHDVRKILSLATGANFVVCTLKDAVKLAPIWPAGEPPLWYVSLSIEVESGATALAEMLRRLPGRGG